MNPAPDKHVLPSETARMAAELEAVRRVLDYSHGQFSLSIAVCNSPALRDHLIAKLQHATTPIRVIRVSGECSDVLSDVRRDAKDMDQEAIFIVGLESIIKSDGGDESILRSLNASRELWAKNLAMPVILWVPDFVAHRLMAFAREFWRYLSHRFEFVADSGASTAAESQHFFGDIEMAASLSEDEKRFRIAELQQRINSVGDEPSGSLLSHVLEWMDELAYLHRALGDLDKAEATLRQSLQINEELGRLEGVANQYGNLGMIHRTRGDLDKAEEMLNKSLDINEKLGSLEGMAINYGNLGLIHQTRSDLDKAEEMLHKSLDIYEKLGQLKGMASNYGNLGLIHQTRGDLDKAEEMHCKSLEINGKLGRLDGMAIQYGNLGLTHQTRGSLDKAEEMLRKSLDIEKTLGRLEGMASQYGNLGNVYGTRGDLDKAEEMLRKSLEINEKLGRLEGMAIQYGNLGMVAAHRGDLPEARALWINARDLFEKIGMPHMVEQTQGLLDSLPPDDPQ